MREFELPEMLRDVIRHMSETVSFREPGRMWHIGTGDIPLATRVALKRSPESCIYVHFWHHSDPDDLHDHPWDWCSLILAVGYWEVSEDPHAPGEFSRDWRAPGSIRFRAAEERHRVELDPAKPGAVSLFITGIERREWGFHTKDGFVVGREYRSVEAFRERWAARAAGGHGI